MHDLDPILFLQKIPNKADGYLCHSLEFCGIVAKLI